MTFAGTRLTCPKKGGGVLNDTQLEAFSYSIAAFLLIVTIHVLMLHVVAAAGRRQAVSSLVRESVLREAFFVVQVVVALLLIHLVTNLLWGLFIWLMGVIPTYRNSLFYSLENYTSLGLTRVQVDETWRTLAPLISLSGVFCLGWSTAILVSLFGHVYMTKPR